MASDSRDARGQAESSGAPPGVEGSHLDPTQAAAAAPSPDPQNVGWEDSGVYLGLALSGGGVRAALFSLGVLIGLVESGVNRWIRSIASVSGGSILNATLAHGEDLSQQTLEQFGEVATKIATVLSERGVFALSLPSLREAVWSGLKAAVTLGPALIIALAMLLTEVKWKVSMPEFDAPWYLVLLVALGVLAVFLVLFFVFSRGWRQELDFAKLIAGLTGKIRPTMKDFKVSEVLHVLVSTDLLSGCPVYFSKKFVFCRPYGWSEPGSLGTATALYASAAFPVVFPPRRLSTRQLDFQNGDSPGFLPRSLKLADGGVYNNLGDDWLEELGKQPDELWPYGALVPEAGTPPAKALRRVVVNASAQSQPLKRLYRGAVARTMSVLYDNTVRPRVRQIRDEGHLLIDISESPLELAESLVKRYGTNATKGGATEKLERARAMGALLAKRPREYWPRLKRATAGTKTKLSKAGRETAAALMHHGYLSAMVLAYVEFGDRLPGLADRSLRRLRETGWSRERGDLPRLRDERYFLELAGPKRPGLLARSSGRSSEAAAE